MGRARDRRRDRVRRHRSGVGALHAPPRRHIAAGTALPRRARLPRAQVVLRRALRRGLRPPARELRRLQPARDREPLRTGLHRRRSRRRGARGHVAHAGGRERLRARVRAAARDRRALSRPLLPGSVDMTIHLSLIVFLPLLAGFIGLLLPRRWAASFATAGAFVTLAYVVVALFRFKSGGGLQFVTDDNWIKELGIHYRLGI